ncbi:MAG TPA: DNA replication and repair protein RecF [Verrucomicrobiae bacterium]|nr:DNA replication and repair protein RecF [Verrucomicrobiae bacterium]
MISDIRLQRFRSYRDESFEFDAGVNIIVGPNASGKTNLLEALLVASRGSSFRAKDTELVAHGAPWSRIDTHGDDGQRTVKFVRQENATIKKEYVIHDQRLVRLSLPRTIPTVLFEPNHLQLLHGSPEARRDYLDTLLEQTIPSYGKIRRDYRRTLAQRNALLKRGPGSRDQLFAWNVRLSDLGAQVVRYRHELVSRLDQEIGGLYQDLSGSRHDSVHARYRTDWHATDQYGSNLLHALEKRQDVDIERGFTSVGPHRDDLVMTFGDREAADVASRGETRTVLLVLKLLEVSLTQEARSQPPILLLDDVFSELDGARRRALTKVIAGYQSFITTTDADVVVQHFMGDCRILPLGT